MAERAESGKSAQKRTGRRRGACARTLALLVPLLAATLFAALLAACAPSRPATVPRGLPPDPVTDGGTQRIGASWLRRVGPGEGILLTRLEGSPYEVGLAAGRLERRQIAEGEAHLDRLFRALLPSSFGRFLVRTLSAMRLGGVEKEIPAEQLEAIAGLADGYEPVPPPSGWDAFRRMVSLHALHDISQRYVDAPALASACTAFTAFPAFRVPGDGGTTGKAPVLLARNFDFEGGDLFDRDKVVSVVALPGRIPYLSVSFAGMLGVVSGFNARGLGIVINAVSGGETGSSGTPVTLLVADVLAKESTVEGAIARIREAKVFVSDLFVVLDGKTGEAVVVEKTPGATGVRRAAPGTPLGATNEVETKEASGRGRPLPPGSTSRRRRERLEELLAGLAGGPRGTGADVAEAAAVAILRDRTGASGAEQGPGNRNAIDAMIQTHSVVFDLSARRAWVAVSPHALGAYVPIDLDVVLADSEGRGEPSPRAPIPADPYLVSGAWDRYRAARGLLLEARVREERKEVGWLSAARADLEKAHALSPDWAEGAAHLGRLRALDGERAGAIAALDEALARDLGPRPLREAITSLRGSLASGTGKDRIAPLPFAPTPDELIGKSR